MKRFLIVGCQRTGTTLMRLLLESHNQIDCIDELLSYFVLAGRCPPPNSTARLVGYKVPVWTEQLCERILSGNELVALANLDGLRTFYKGEKIVFMVRNSLDTVSSMMSLKMGATSWFEQTAIPVLKKKMSDSEFVRAFGADIALIDSSSDPIATVGALYWKFKTSALCNYVNAKMPVHIVEYETLVTSPEPVLRGLVAFLGLEWDHALLEHHRLPHSQTRVGKAIGGTDASRCIDETSIGRWRNSLNRSQVQSIRAVTQVLEAELASAFSLGKQWPDCPS